MADKLDQLSKKREKQKKEIQRVKNDYKQWQKTNSHKDLMDYLEEESDNLMRMAKNRFTVVEGKVVQLDDGMSLSLLYKSAGLDMAREYIKSKLK